MIHSAFIDRITGELTFRDNGQDIFNGIVNIKADNVNSGSENVTCVQVGEFQCRLQKLRFCLVDNAFFFGGENYFCTGTEGEGFIGFETEESFYDWYLADWEDTWHIERSSIEE